MHVAKCPLTVNIYIQIQNSEVEVTYCAALWEIAAQNNCHSSR